MLKDVEVSQVITVSSPSAASQFPLRGTRLLADAVRNNGTVILVGRDQVVSAQRHNNDVVYFIDRGLTVSKKMLRDGRQQTIAISVPGDIIDYEAFTIGAVFSTTYALSEVTLIGIPTEEFSTILREDPLYESEFLRFVAYQGVLAKEWLVRLGCMSATEKTAHFFCEFFWRMDMAGYTSENYCEIALKQKELADILGLSLVQQNRSLSALRVRGLVNWSTRGFRMLDRQGLERLANFNASYLVAALSNQVRPLAPSDANAEQSTTLVSGG